MNKYKVTVGAWHTVDVHAMNNAGAETAALASMEAMGLCPKLWHEVEVTDVLLKEENVKPHEITTKSKEIAMSAFATGDFEIFMRNLEGIELLLDTGAIVSMAAETKELDGVYIIRQKLA